MGTSVGLCSITLNEMLEIGHAPICLFTVAFKALVFNPGPEDPSPADFHFNQ